jgi:hypothetical protein
VPRPIAVYRSRTVCTDPRGSRTEQEIQFHHRSKIFAVMMAVYADETAAVNSLRSDRAPVEEFARFRGFA